MAGRESQHSMDLKAPANPVLSQGEVDHLAAGIRGAGDHGQTKRCSGVVRRTDGGRTARRHLQDSEVGYRALAEGMKALALIKHHLKMVSNIKVTPKTELSTL